MGGGGGGGGSGHAQTHTRRLTAGVSCLRQRRRHSAPTNHQTTLSVLQGGSGGQLRGEGLQQG